MSAEERVETPRPITVPVSRADRIYRTVTTGAAMTSLLVMALIAIFLFLKSWPAIHEAGFHFFTRFEWDPDGSPALYGVASAVYGTVVMAIIALVIALPISIGTALYINEYAPRRIQRILITLIDLLAAIPSVVFGLWGRDVLNEQLAGISKFLYAHFRFVPIFHKQALFFGNSFFVCGVVLALMIVPIITSISRAVMAEVPRPYCEAALALGGTKTGMISEVIFPFSRGGLVGAAMLGLGRAMGETIAVALILSINQQVMTNVLAPGGSAIAGLIAVKFGEASINGRSALLGAGLVLFLITLVVNFGARLIVTRSRPPKGASK